MTNAFEAAVCGPTFKPSEDLPETHNDRSQLRLDSDRLALAESIGRETSKIVLAVFHCPDGSAIKESQWRRAWEAARAAAGYPIKTVHDFRRTAARNLERAGVSRSVAMAMIGHKTESMYRRYSIVDEVRMREEAEKLQAWATGQQKPTKAGGRVRVFKHRAAAAR